MSQVAAPSEGPLANVRLHRPGAIAVYMVFGGALGFFLYGQNISRRGKPAAGRLICTLSALTLVAAVILGAAGKRMVGLGLIGVLVAIGIYKREYDAYCKSIVQGARPTRWWPPGLVLVGLVVALLVIQKLFFPEVWEKLFESAP
jgi:hypothetical protein